MNNLIQDPEIIYKSKEKYLLIFAMIWLTFLLITIFTSVKTFDLFGYTFVAAAIGYPITYIFSDIFTEVYGFRNTRRIIWTGFFCVGIAVLVTTLYSYIPGSKFYTQTASDSFNYIFRSVPIIAIASVISFYIGEYVNSIVLAKLKVKTNGNFAELRYILSTFLGQICDNMVGVILITSFSSIFTISEAKDIVITSVIFCTLWEIIATPITRLAIKYIKYKEGMDAYDRNTPLYPI